MMFSLQLSRQLNNIIYEERTNEQVFVLSQITQMEKQIRTNDEQILRLKEKMRTVETTFAGFNRNLPKYATNYYKLVFNKKMRLGKLKPSSMIEVATRKSKAADRSSVSKKSSWDDRGGNVKGFGFLKFMLIKL